jgi:hypothetical protein
MQRAEIGDRKRRAIDPGEIVDNAALGAITLPAVFGSKPVAWFVSSTMLSDGWENWQKGNRNIALTQASFGVLPILAQQDLVRIRSKSYSSFDRFVEASGGKLPGPTGRIARVGANPNVQEVPIANLKPIHPVPRKGMPKRHIENLAKSISEHGYDVTQPVSATRLPNGDLLITGGHHRVAAMKSLAEATVPVRIYQTATTDPVFLSKMLGIGKITGMYTSTYKPSLTAAQQAEVDAYIAAWRAANGY